LSLISTRNRYFVGGFHIVTDLTLPGARKIGGDVSPDDLQLDVHTGTSPIPKTTPDGDVLAEYRQGDYGHCVVRTPSHLLFRLFGSCDFHITHDLRTVTAIHNDGVADDLLATWCCGALLSTLTVLSGSWAIHAGAIEFPDGTGLAFAGGSGAGKTTLVAACCLLGSKLVTDDVLIINFREAERVEACGGCTELRLRRPATELGHLPETWPSRVTADGRLAVRPPIIGSEQARLGRIVIPSRSESPTLQVRRLTGAEAFMELAKYPRTAGWIEPRILASRFHILSSLVRGTTVWRAEIPVGAPVQSIEELRQLTA